MPIKGNIANINKMMVMVVLAMVVCVVKGDFESQLDLTVKWGRREVVDRSLRGFWKLADDSNFRINSKVTMINEQSDRKKRVSSMLNFLAPTDGLRET